MTSSISLCPPDKTQLRLACPGLPDGHPGDRLHSWGHLQRVQAVAERDGAGEPGALVTGPVNIPTNKYCGKELNVPNVTSWQEAVSGLYRRRLLEVPGLGLAGMYRRSLQAKVEDI